LLTTQSEQLHLLLTRQLGPGTYFQRLHLVRHDHQWVQMWFQVSKIGIGQNNQLWHHFLNSDTNIVLEESGQIFPREMIERKKLL
jgi:hypothetical protein